MLMFANLTSALDFQSKALVLRAERQQILASNIANADTPGYAARSLDFKQAMTEALGNSAGAGSTTTTPGLALSVSTSNQRHISMSPGDSASTLGHSQALGYAVQTQPSLDGNSVDLDRERAAFTDNAIRYESTLRFINGQAKTILSAIQGQ